MTDDRLTRRAGVGQHQPPEPGERGAQLGVGDLGEPGIEGCSPPSAVSGAGGAGRGGAGSGSGPCTSVSRATAARPKNRLIRSITSGARCCSSRATPDATRSFNAPSRPSASGQVAAASSAPTTAAHSALSRPSTPPPRRATIGAATREAAMPAPRSPPWRKSGRRSPLARRAGSLAVW